jgi:dUTP pyrophosphatase
MQSILIKRTEEAKQFPLPSPKKAGDVGFDLYTVEETILPSHSSLPTDIPTGVSIKLPEGTWGLVINRSSSPRKLGIEVVPGVIDNGYTGELFACCFNRTGQDIKVEKGTRIAQFIVLPALVPTLEEVDTLPETERGSTGFGSTN